ncbi:MAG: tetratricopeptide repeat protein [Flavobacteriaceae bacterium]|nr:tetratricopeptide repeat protein [Flavobacteriaceae bacterium]
MIKRTYLIIGLFCLFGSALHSQNQKISDSLIKIYQNGEYEEKDELDILKEITDTETNTEKLLTYSLQLIVAAKTVDSARYEYLGYLQKGNAYRLKSDLTKALESYFAASKVATNSNLKDKEASINISIADVYSIMGDSETSLNYYRQALQLLEKNKDSINLASAQLNLGDEFYNQKELDSALYYFSESGKIFKAKKFELGEAYNLGNVGLVYAEIGENEKAEENLNGAIETLEKLEDYYPICVYINAMSDIYQDRNNNTKALEYAERSLQLAKKYGLKDQVGDSYLKLSDLYEYKGQIKKSFDFYKTHIIYKDSVKGLKDVQLMANERTEHEVEKKQVEVDLLNEQKKTQKIIAGAIGVALLFICFLAYSLFKRNKYMRKTNEIIEYEKQRSEDLLKNILPEETAQELKENGTVKAKRFESVSVLFTDFKGFTKYSESLSPEKLVESIDFYFSKFDEIIEKHGLEKIKTVGDAYMCAGGLPFPSDNHALKICLAGLDIVDFVAKTMNDPNHELAKFDIRVGVNTGPVVSGIVGTKKFVYDIWGDTVNVASRMESSGEIGKVNVSESTYNLLTKYHEFEFTSRGAIEAKGKGKINMYFVNIGTQKQSIYA